MVTCSGHIGIHEGVDVRTYVRTDVHDVMAIKLNFRTSMAYHIFLTMVPSARAELRYHRLPGLLVCSLNDLRSGTARQCVNNNRHLRTDRFITFKYG